MTTEEAQCFMNNFGNEVFDSKDGLDNYMNAEFREPIKCPGDSWMFNTSVFTSTAVTEWDIVCDKAQLANFDTQSFMIGKLLG